MDDGLVCDSRCRFSEGIYAVGHVARWYHATLGGPVRLENRTTATEHAATVAANILGADRPFTPVPYFWTDQYDVKIQLHGFPSQHADVTVLDGDVTAQRFALRYLQDGKVTAVIGWNMPKQAYLGRKEVMEALSANGNK